MSAISFQCPDCGGIGGDCTHPPADDDTRLEDVDDLAREDQLERLFWGRWGW